MEWLGPILTGGVAAAVVALIDHALLWKLNRKAKLQDDGKKEEREMAQTIQGLKTAQRVILHDRIKYLCRSYIEDGEVRFDDRQDLTDMHNIYHTDLGGNGHLDQLMSEVMKLPLKK